MFFHLEFEWQKVFLGLKDFSQYSNRSKQFSSLGGPDSSSDFKVFPSLFQAFKESSKRPDNK